MNSPVSRFRVVLRQLREDLGWSQEMLANKAEINRSYLGEIERGLAMPSLATVFKIANAMGLRVSDIIARCEEPDVECRETQP